MIPTYLRHSASKLNLYAECPSMFIAEYVIGEKQSVGSPAHRGVAVEDGVSHGLNDLDASLKDCVDVAHMKYDTLSALSGDPRREKYRETIADMVKTALKELRGYGKPDGMQGLVEWKPEGLKLPIVGYYDYQWSQHGMLADLKTTERMPSEIKIGHARQVALYAASDNLDARLIYVTPRKLETYRLENVLAHREALRKIAVNVENLLSLSDNPAYYLTLFAPALDSFYWGNPEARATAYKLWGI
ncbi:MAG TPA: PD-(D/E)XK nuclease family protein [Candidatus Eisenbacteria bacterium]|jgi:hypothetical protein|nr:PD-(D/E)XK nuclease family protein [Candidatus Eisenbacteria bacterium]